MAARQGRVRVYYDGDTTGLRRATSQAEGSIRGMSQRSSRHLQDLNRHTSTLGGSLRGAAKAAAGAAAAYVGISAASSAISTTADLAKTTKSLHDNLGLSIKSSIEFGAQLKIRGQDAKQAQQAFATFAGVLHQAAQGSATATAKLTELGISGQRLKFDLAHPQQALADVSDGLKELGASAAKTDDQRKLFGRGWQALSPILREGSGHMKELLNQAKPVFDALGGDGVKSVGRLIDAQHQAQLQSLALQVSFTKNLAPALITVLGAIGPVIGALKDAGRWSVNAAKNVAHFASTTGTLAERFKSTIGVLVDFAKLEFGVGKAAVQAASAVGGAFGDAGHAVGRFGRGAGGVAKGVANAFGQMAHVIGRIIQWVIGAVNKALGALNDLKNAVPDVSLPSLPSPGDALNSVGSLFGQRGRIVPGRGSGDKVPAMLEPGEVVINRKAVQMLGGPEAVDAINHRFKRFAKGGKVTGGGALGAITRDAGRIVGGAAKRFVSRHSSAGYHFPFEHSSGLSWGRTDMGVDFTGTGPISAIGNAHINRIGAPGWPEGGGVNYTLTSGPRRGSTIYTYEGVDAKVGAGQNVRAGQTIANFRPGGSIEVGWGLPSGAAMAASHYSEGQVTSEGSSMRKFLSKLSHHQRGGIVGYQSGGVVGDFARSVVRNKAPHEAALALFEAGYAESGMRDLPGGDASSEGALQVLASTASSMGIDPHNESQIADAFLTRGYYGKGSAISLAQRGLGPAAIAHLVQGNATGTGVYSAQRAAAIRAMRAAGLKWDKHGLPRIGSAPASGGSAPGAPPKIKIPSPNTVAGMLAHVQGGLGAAPAPSSDSGDTSSTDDLQQQIAQLLQEIRDLQAQQTDAQVRATNLLNSQSGPNGAIANALAAVVSGSIGGQVGLGFASPSFAGGLASY